MTRPKHLPEFNEPPLDEVVLGVQFDPIPSYTAVDARAIWDLYRSEFPEIEEQPPLSPSFETFGGSPQHGIQFRFGPMPPATRLWFKTSDGSHLIQFQPDRLLTNWRKHLGLVPYPRYEQIASKFAESFAMLAAHVESARGYALAINQAELTYINVIPVDDFRDSAAWLRAWSAPPVDIEVFNLAFHEVALDEMGRPAGRLYHEVQTVLSVDGRTKALRFALTYRGKPQEASLDSALNFLAQGRETIVRRFADMTTDQAHERWKRNS